MLNMKVKKKTRMLNVTEQTAVATSGRTHTPDLTHCTPVTTPVSCSGNAGVLARA